MKIALTIDAAIRKTFKYPGKTIHFPGGAITLVEKLPANSSTSR